MWQEIKRVGFREWYLSFRSPIRWGYFGLGIAISLFLVEISLSLWQILISFLGGDVVVAIWVQIGVGVAASLTLLVSLVLLVIIARIGWNWSRHDTVDDTAQSIKKIQKDMIVIKRDINQIKRGKGIGRHRM